MPSSLASLRRKMEKRTERQKLGKRLLSRTRQISTCRRVFQFRSPRFPEKSPNPNFLFRNPRRVNACSLSLSPCESNPPLDHISPLILLFCFTSFEKVPFFPSSRNSISIHPSRRENIEKYLHHRQKGEDSFVGGRR